MVRSIKKQGYIGVAEISLFTNKFFIIKTC